MDGNLEAHIKETEARRAKTLSALKEELNNTEFGGAGRKLEGALETGRDNQREGGGE